ncbi:hypothetical protein [Methylobacterium gnaphalii]|uniref:Uncharacterized protein n=1 Tax=Methylobacterium gnaphalii TaxID=1010610 RepID=A0A512JR87_9HYPH|nr:hypothetical protein [Methylobacterium gnaphalii]GEP12460.1 hypothetical protein MGN01_43050 [Methylobacterium gnaphalii]GJD71528.1 hypothetical protein MMMDOFMJ_4489 [Methylobacterium gnaphalii]GLS49786.1 hypothetical protein GCM10007885_26370 [Methylobacterium gnaphalii]
MARKANKAGARGMGSGRADGRLRTTLIVDRRLVTALKVIAVDRQCAVNDIIVEAIEAVVSAYHAGQPSRAGPDDTAWVTTTLTGLRREIERLAARVDALEARPGRSPTSRGDNKAVPSLHPKPEAVPGPERDASPAPATRRGEDAAPGSQPRPHLDAAGVRREAAALIEEHGAPMAHRALLTALAARFTLPGQDASENLRTILVHPRAKGFVLIKGQGYALEEQADAVTQTAKRRDPSRSGSSAP